MTLEKAPVVKAQMLIRRPVEEVFAAFVDPAVTTRFWFTKSSGKLEPGREVRWDWEMYGASTQVRVREVEPDRRILIEWDDPPCPVEWLFTPRPDGTTLVSISNWGFHGSGDEVVARAIDSQGGFSFVLAGLKALLEHGIALNLVADHHPDAHVAGESRASFTYFEPSNDRIEEPTVDQVLESMRQDEAFQGSHSPVGQLHWSGPGGATLYFVRHPRRGWHLQFDDGFGEAHGPRRSLVAVDPGGDRNGWVEQWAEGDTAYFLAACFLPTETAERVVREFMATREPSPAITWEPLHWDVHRREGPPDDESLVLEEAADPE